MSAIGQKRTSAIAFTCSTHPAPEVAAASHDRAVIQIMPERIDAWLTPEGRSREELQATLADRADAYYDHQVARAAWPAACELSRPQGKRSPPKAAGLTSVLLARLRLEYSAGARSSAG